MKSLVEEASSVAKAIEKAWNRAGNPQTFSVKVFENPETNFFGFVKKSAKVGIYYEEEAPAPRKQGSFSRDQRDRSGSYQRQGDQRGRSREQANASDERSVVKTEENGNRPQRHGTRQGHNPRQRPERSDRSEQRPYRERTPQTPIVDDQEPTPQQPRVTGERQDHGSEQRERRQHPRQDRDRQRRNGGQGQRRERPYNQSREQAHAVTEQGEQAPTEQQTTTPVQTSIVPMVAPVQRKVLKASGRRYSAPHKQGDEQQRPTQTSDSPVTSSHDNDNE